VPYLKISRDKRGYETYYLLEPPSDRSKQSRPRILFWFRTPPQVKVGREPFSEEIRQAIESQNPDLKFDWPRLMSVQPPPIEVQRWRERRRLERAARQAVRETPEPEVEVAEPGTNGAEEMTDEVAEESPIDDVDSPRHSIEAAVDADEHSHPAPASQAASPAGEPAVSTGSTSDAPEASPSSARRRRRRRRGRRHGQIQSGEVTPQPPSQGSPPSSDEV
jgi:hypothetical protein